MENFQYSNPKLQIITNDPIKYIEDYYPCWSPDSKKIAWLSINRKVNPETGLWVMKADGSEKKQFTDFAQYPSWSPDGHQIVYSAFLEDSVGAKNEALWLINADGSNKRSLIF